MCPILASLFTFEIDLSFFSIDKSKLLNDDYAVLLLAGRVCLQYVLGVLNSIRT